MHAGILPTPLCCLISTGVLVLGCGAGVVHAQADASADANTDKSAEEGADTKADIKAETKAERHWEGAIGLSTSYRPEYSGASRWVTKVTPAVFLRYGRLTVTNASGFVTRRADDVVRGLGVDLVNAGGLRANLSLRFDAGRSESTSSEFAGLGDIKPTVRARLNLGWRLPGPWRLGASFSVDALGRGGGNLGDLSLGWEQRISPDTVLSSTLALTVAGDRYMQTYYGVSEAQAARSARQPYEAAAGLRDLNLGLGLRHDFATQWTLLAGAGFTRLLGPAARSPLTGQVNGWGLNVGVARRF
jgi:outer membrane protein